MKRFWGWLCAVLTAGSVHAQPVSDTESPFEIRVGTVCVQGDVSSVRRSVVFDTPSNRTPVLVLPNASQVWALDALGDDGAFVWVQVFWAHPHQPQDSVLGWMRFDHVRASCPDDARLPSANGLPVVSDESEARRVWESMLAEHPSLALADWTERWVRAQTPVESAALDSLSGVEDPVARELAAAALAALGRSSVQEEVSEAASSDVNAALLSEETEIDTSLRPLSLDRLPSELVSDWQNLTVPLATGRTNVPPLFEDLPQHRAGAHWTEVFGALTRRPGTACGLFPGSEATPDWWFLQSVIAELDHCLEEEAAFDRAEMGRALALIGGALNMQDDRVWATIHDFSTCDEDCERAAQAAWYAFTNRQQERERVVERLDGLEGLLLRWRNLATR